MITPAAQSAASQYLSSYLEENATLEGTPCGACDECREGIACRDQTVTGNDPALAVAQILMNALDPFEAPFFRQNYFAEGPQAILQGLAPVDLIAAFEEAKRTHLTQPKETR